MKILVVDQWIKIFFFDVSGQLFSLFGGSEWYQVYCSVELVCWLLMCIYIICVLCVEQEEVDVEFVFYGENGLVLVWVIYVWIGDCL